MIRLISNVHSCHALELSSRMLAPTSGYISQQRGRRRTLTPVPWLPAKKEKEGNINQNVNNKIKSLLGTVVQREALVISENSAQSLYDSKCRITDIPENSRRVGLIVRKIGMLPQWTKNGSRILCTLLEVAENHVVSVVSPESWYKASVVGKRKAFNRDGPMWRVSVGAVNANPTGFTTAYRKQFVKAGVPTKETIGSFLVSGDAIPTPGHPLDVRHFGVGQFVTATGKTIDWGFQGGMHRWGMRGQPTRRTTKSHRRIGSVGSVGDARIWPGKRMPGHMGYEWRTVSGLEIVRINIDKQVIFVKGSVPGDVGEMLLLKDCLQSEKRLKTGPVPTWAPSLETINEETEDQEEDVAKKLGGNEQFMDNIFRFTSPSITFTDADAKKSAGRDKTKAKIAKVKK